MKRFFVILCIISCFTGACCSNKDNTFVSEQIEDAIPIDDTVPIDDDISIDDYNPIDLYRSTADSAALAEYDKAQDELRKVEERTQSLELKKSRILWISIGITLLQLIAIIVAILRKNMNLIKKLTFLEVVRAFFPLLLVSVVLFFMTWLCLSAIDSDKLGLWFLIIVIDILLAWGLFKLFKIKQK